MFGGGLLVIPWIPVAAALLALGRARRLPWIRTAAWLALSVYAAFVIALTLFPLLVQPEVLAQGRAGQYGTNNFIPLGTIAPAVRAGLDSVRMHQVVGNFVTLMPLASLVPVARGRMPSPFRFAAIAFGVSIAIELAQLAQSALYGFSFKITDVDDVMLNGSGAVLAFLIVAFVLRRMPALRCRLGIATSRSRPAARDREESIPFA